MGADLSPVSILARRETEVETSAIFITKGKTKTHSPWPQQPKKNFFGFCSALYALCSL